MPLALVPWFSGIIWLVSYLTILLLRWKLRLQGYIHWLFQSKLWNFLVFLTLCCLQEGRDYDFPAECDGVVGKRMKLTLKRNEYNVKHPSSSISVQRFTLCRNLLENFEAADPHVCLKHFKQFHSMCNHIVLFSFISFFAGCTYGGCCQC